MIKNKAFQPQRTLNRRKTFSGLPLPLTIPYFHSPRLLIFLCVLLVVTHAVQRAHPCISVKSKADSFRASQSSFPIATVAMAMQMERVCCCFLILKCKHILKSHLFLCVWLFCLHECLFTACVPGAPGGQRAVDPQGLELQVCKTPCGC